MGIAAYNFVQSRLDRGRPTAPGTKAGMGAASVRHWGNYRPTGDDLQIFDWTNVVKPGEPTGDREQLKIDLFNKRWQDAKRDQSRAAMTHTECESCKRAREVLSSIGDRMANFGETLASPFVAAGRRLSRGAYILISGAVMYALIALVIYAKVTRS